MPPLITLVLYLLAACRATTLITHDAITRPARTWLITRFDGQNRTHRALVYALGEPDGDDTGCPWCMSVWVAAVTAPLLWWWPTSPAVLIPIIVLAASQTTGMIHTWGRT